MMVVGKYFFNRKYLYLTIKEKIGNLDMLKLRCSVIKSYSQDSEKQATVWKNIFATYIT